MLRRALRSMVKDQVKYSAPRLWPGRLWSEPLRKLLTLLNVPVWAQLEQRWSSIVKISTVTRDADKQRIDGALDPGIRMIQRGRQRLEARGLRDRHPLARIDHLPGEWNRIRPVQRL